MTLTSIQSIDLIQIKLFKINFYFNENDTCTFKKLALKTRYSLVLKDLGPSYLSLYNKLLQYVIS